MKILGGILLMAISLQQLMSAPDKTVEENLETVTPQTEVLPNGATGGFDLNEHLEILSKAYAPTPVSKQVEQANADPLGDKRLAEKITGEDFEIDSGERLPTEETVPEMTVEDLGEVNPKKEEESNLQSGFKPETAKEAMSKVSKDADFSKIDKDAIAVSQDEILTRIPIKNRDLFGAISQVESSGGKNRIHNNAGVSRAIGSFGLIPTTSLADVSQKTKGNLATEYPEIFKELQKQIKDRNWVEAGKLMVDPDIEAEVVKDYWETLDDYVDAKFPESLDPDLKPLVKILAWKEGAGAASKIYRKDGVDGVLEHPYVKSVLKNMDKPLKYEKKDKTSQK